MGSPGDSAVKNPPADAGDTSLIPRWGRGPAEGHGFLLQYPCLGSPIVRGAWQATVWGVAKSRTRLSAWTTTPGQVWRTLSSLGGNVVLVSLLPSAQTRLDSGFPPLPRLSVENLAPRASQTCIFFEFVALWVGVSWSEVRHRSLWTCLSAAFAGSARGQTAEMTRVCWERGIHVLSGQGGSQLSPSAPVRLRGAFLVVRWRPWRGASPDVPAGEAAGWRGRGQAGSFPALGPSRAAHILLLPRCPGVGAKCGNVFCEGRAWGRGPSSFQEIFPTYF